MSALTGQSTSALLRLIPVCGTRRKSWQLVNEHGALIRFFEGTTKQAKAEARRVGAEVVLK